jgi:hypothetical protein
MAKVAVHNFIVWDHQRGRSVIPPMKGTAERIDRVGGKIVPGTTEQVEASALDARCCYLPHSAEVNASA